MLEKVNINAREEEKFLEKKKRIASEARFDTSVNCKLSSSLTRESLLA